MTRGVRDDVVTVTVYALMALLHDPEVTKNWETLERAIRSVLDAALAANFHFTVIAPPAPCDCPESERAGTICGMTLCPGREYCPYSGEPSFGFRDSPDEPGSSLEIK